MSAQIQLDHGSIADPPPLPPEIAKLFPRERQIAQIVYANGLVTAKDVEFQLSRSLTNSAVRSFLNRLVRKGMLVQQRCGKRGSILYAPALTDLFAREIAVKQFAEDFYGGSLEQLADELGNFFSFQPSLTELVLAYDRSQPVELNALSSRMREIADIVYRSGGSTNRDIQEQLGVELTISCIKTLLGRMVVRGLIRQRRSGRHRELAYLPGVVTSEVRRLALKRFIEARFAGSEGSALRTALQLMHTQQAL